MSNIVSVIHATRVIIVTLNAVVEAFVWVMFVIVGQTDGGEMNVIKPVAQEKMVSTVPDTGHV